MGGASGDSPAEYSVNGASVRVCASPARAQYDASVVLAAPGVHPPKELAGDVLRALELDPSLGKKGGVHVCSSEAACGGRLVIASTGQLTEYDDIRVVSESYSAGVSRAIQCGCSRVLVVVSPHPRFPRAPLVALLAALEALYVPLQIRETFPALAHHVTSLAVHIPHLDQQQQEHLLREAVALENARAVSRDIGGGDPERMSPARAAEYLVLRFRGTSVSVRVTDNQQQLAQQYPLLHAVTRADTQVLRHRGCVVHLEYTPEEYDRTAMLVGKGVTYDTGGADVKVNGAMVGMSRDKCGAAAVAGLLAAAEQLKPKVKIVAALGFVRNSVGSDAYVSDELLKSRSGMSVRVGNTDAEGRMVMADLLTEMRERAGSEVCPHLYTVATLTGHAVRAVGAGYTIAMDNHRARGHAQQLQQHGDTIADMFEVSTLRREDLRWHAGRAPGDQLLQAHSSPSTQQPRGHQTPAAFLLLVSGLDRGDVPYTHLDVAASAGDFPDNPTAAPLLALASLYGLVASC